MIHLDEVIGQSQSGEVYIADYVFKDDDRMGVVGSIYRPVFAEEWTDATSEEGLQKHLTRWWADARRRGDLRSIGEFAAALYAEKGAGIIWDEGDRTKASRAREYLGVSTEDAPLFTCCGGGKCLTRKVGWSRVMDPVRLFHLLDLERGRIEAWTYFVNHGRTSSDAFMGKAS